MLLTEDPSAFPTAPPPSVDDPEVITAHDWAAFDRVQEMSNHWDRAGWTPSTRAYYWMLSFPADSALAEHARHCQDKIRNLNFDSIDADGLHLTLGRIGTTDDVSLEQLDTLLATTAAIPTGRFRLQAIPMTASRGAVRYSIAPWTPVLDLHSKLSATTAQCQLPLRKPTAVLRPHIGIAYCNRPTDACVVREAIRPLRDMDSVGVPVDHLELVELRREDRAYRWRTIDQLALN
ncbi:MULTISPECIES: 2'-5' RNA ligase family protein [Streptomyces]|uniref:2'-5' RNA ligase family protein n=1 Tax=Streptomyces durocortorensis TaxID=2811104 RepID=A0ABS2HWQ5_9ACTN|nr:2'-5' RNA ligase family protein [Streptomyces durocortorensis]MBM7055451.1 2'-5' RNA ligase family protein [Streptomyces durocortorensis]